jgi:hypothetical protein
MVSLLPPILSVVSGILVCRARWSLRETALLVAWYWSLVAVLAWGIAASLPLTAASSSPLTSDAAWYLAAVATLCPGIAVLGSRRPVVRVWSWFVLLPLLLVFGAPVATAGWSRSDATLLIATPTTLGVGIVLLMGTGNYIGTRYSGPALCLAASVFAVVGPLSEWWGGWWSRESGRTAGVLLVCLSLGWGSWLAARRRPCAEAGWDRVWSDFRETFGVVWSRRVQDRINARAVTEAWDCRLEAWGIVAAPHLVSGIDQPAPDGASALSSAVNRPPSLRDIDKLGQALRWHLDRFVSSVWVDRRLHPPPTPEA